MPRFYFDIDDGVSQPDPDGVDLPDAQAAWAEAVRCCGEMLKDIDGRLPPNSEWKMEVTDKDAQLIFSLRFFAEDHRST